LKEIPTSIKQLEPDVVWEMVRLAGRASPLETASTLGGAAALVAVSVGVAVDVGVAVEVGVAVAVLVAVAVGVEVAVLVGVAVAVLVGVGVGVAPPTISSAPMSHPAPCGRVSKSMSSENDKGVPLSNAL
jgi:hypothetical protein